MSTVVLFRNRANNSNIPNEENELLIDLCYSKKKPQKIMLNNGNQSKRRRRRRRTKEGSKQGREGKGNPMIHSYKAPETTAYSERVVCGC